MAHSSDYSHIWAETNNPLTIDEISAALGVPYDNLEDLYFLSGINKMSKRKPVSRNNSGILSEAERMHDGNYRDYYGLKMPSGSSDPISAANETSAWEHLRPRGISYNEWLRILDFDGYHSNAVAPIAAVEAQTIELLQQSSFPFYFQYKKDGDIYQFGLKEMPLSNDILAPILHLSDCYLAIAFSYNGTIYYRTSQYTIGSDSILGADTIVFERADFPQVSLSANITYYVLAAKLRYWIGDVKPGGGQLFYAIPFPSQAASHNILTLNPAAPASISITLRKLARSVSSGMIWNNQINSNTYAPVRPLENNQYFEISNANPNIHFGFEVVNSGGSGFSLDLNGIRMQLSPSQDLLNPTGYISASQVFYSNSPSTGMTAGSWSIAVPAHSTIYLFVRTADNFGQYLNGSTQTIQQQRETLGGIVQMRLSGGDQTIGSNQINLRYKP